MKNRTSENKEEPKKTLTQYVCMKVLLEQCIGNIMEIGIYDGGHNFNRTNTYSSLGFCTVNQALKFYDKLDFNTFQEVLNFLNKNWGWKILSMVPCEYSKKYLFYTFYREYEA